MGEKKEKKRKERKRTSVRDFFYSARILSRNLRIARILRVLYNVQRGGSINSIKRKITWRGDMWERH
jgi:hypothetical protein